MLTKRKFDRRRTEIKAPVISTIALFLITLILYFYQDTYNSPYLAGVNSLQKEAEGQLKPLFIETFNDFGCDIQLKNISLIELLPKYEFLDLRYEKFSKHLVEKKILRNGLDSSAENYINQQQCSNLSKPHYTAAINTITVKAYALLEPARKLASSSISDILFYNSVVSLFQFFTCMAGVMTLWNIKLFLSESESHDAH